MVPDPEEVFDYNRYMYARGNPLAYNDPSGHICVALVNVGNTCANPTNWDAVQLSLDAAGVLDPTPVSDGTNAVISLARGNYVDAGLSAIAMVPYLGDLAKSGKYADEAYAVGKQAWKKGTDFLGLSDEAGDTARVVGDCIANNFSADTLVMTAAGAKPIADLVVGDLVLAYNEETGQVEVHPILDTLSHVDPQIVLLTVDGETLETTAGHPFYEMASAPWLAVGQLQGRWTDAGGVIAARKKGMGSHRPHPLFQCFLFLLK